jgi:hypothetical protein
MKTKSKAPSSARKKPAARKRPVSAKPRSKTKPRKQRTKRASPPLPAPVATPADVPPVADAAAVPPVDAATPAAPPVAKHKWRNRFFLFILIFVLGGVVFNSIGGNGSATKEDTKTASDDVVVVQAGKATWMIVIDVSVLLVAIAVLVWAWASGGKLWEHVEFKKLFETDDERKERERMEREAAMNDPSHPDYAKLKREWEARGRAPGYS